MPHTRMTPLSFSLGNSVNNESTLVTLNQGDDGQTLNWAAHNNTPGDIQAPQASGTASASNYHFAICLPPGLLASPDELVIAPLAGWDMSSPTKDAQGYDCLYVLRTGGDYNLPHDHDAADALTFELQRVFVADHKAWSQTTVQIKSRGLLLAGAALPPAMQRLPLTILHTISVDLSNLEGVNSMDGLKEEIKVLRNQVAPPLNVRILDSWNMLASNSWRELELEVSVNKDFFKNEDDPFVGVLDTTASITIEPLVTTGEPDIYVRATDNVGWPAEEGEDKAVVHPASADLVINEVNKLVLQLGLRTGDMGMPKLKIKFTGFTSMGEAGPDGEGVGEFTVELPLMVGPMEASALSAEPHLGVIGRSGEVAQGGIFEVRHSPEPDTRHLAMGVAYDNESNKKTWIESRGAPLFINTTGQHLVLQRNRRGNVGIGTDNPEHLLDVNGTSRIRGSLLVEGDLEVTGHIRADRSSFGTTPDGEDIYWGVHRFSSPVSPDRVLNHNLESELTTLSGQAIVLSSAGNNSVRMSNALMAYGNGNVTIGGAAVGTDPEFNLTIKGFLWEGSSNLLEVKADTENNEPAFRISAHVPPDGTEAWPLSDGYISLQSSGPLVINEENTRPLFINPQGGNDNRVVIGSTQGAPYADNLSVEGSVHASSWRLQAPESVSNQWSTRIESNRIVMNVDEHRSDRIEINSNGITIGGSTLTPAAARVLMALENGTLRFKIRNSRNEVLNNQAEFGGDWNGSDSATLMTLKIKND